MARKLSSENDSLRLTAAGDIVLQRFERAGHALTWSELEADAAAPAQGLPGVDPLLLRRVLANLVAEGDLHQGERRGETIYFLSDRCAAHMSGVRKENDRRCQRVLQELFGFEAHTYRRPFLETAYTIMDKAATDYVLHLANGNPLRSAKARTLLKVTVERVSRENHGVDPAKLASEIIRFFNKTGLDFSFLKWRIIQSFFVMRMLGLDPDSLLLTKAMFDGTTLVVDTNIAIDALEPSRAQHREFRMLAEAAAVIGLNIAITSITLRELESWSMGERARFQAVEAGTPGAESRVDGHLLARYRREKSADSAYSLDDLFAPFENARRRLEDEFGIDMIDDDWFDEEEGSPETLEFADALQRRGDEVLKTYESALHDAVMLRWIRWMSSQGRTTNLLSSDRSLPSTGQLPLEGGRVIHPAAFVNWVSPAVRGVVDEADFPRLYARLLRHQLLPLRDLFAVGHLRAFVEQERVCSSLAPHEVDSFLEYLRGEGASKDPHAGADRVEIMAELRSRRTSSPDDWHPDPDDDWFAEAGPERDPVETATSEAPSDPTESTLERETQLARRAALFKAGIGLAATSSGAIGLTAWAFTDPATESLLEGLGIVVALLPVEIFAGRWATRKWVGPNLVLLPRALQRSLRFGRSRHES